MNIDDLKLEVAELYEDVKMCEKAGCDLRTQFYLNDRRRVLRDVAKDFRNQEAPDVKFLNAVLQKPIFVASKNRTKENN